MSVDAKIRSGDGDKNYASVSPYGEVYTLNSIRPPLDGAPSPLPFRADFVDSSDSNDMAIDGSSTEVDFCVVASQTKDIYIGSVFITLADAGAALNEFGSISALTNGCRFYWKSQDEGEIIINESIKSNWEWIKQGGIVPGFGQTNSSFRANNVSGGSEGFPIFVDFTLLFKLPFGIRLRKGTTDALKIRVRDNLSNVDEFTAVAYGQQI